MASNQKRAAEVTTNTERAAEIIRDGLAQAWNAGPIFDTRKFPDAAARALADAGLLMSDTTVEAEYRIVPADSNGGIYQTRRWTRQVTEWKPDD